MAILEQANSKIFSKKLIFITLGIIALGVGGYFQFFHAPADILPQILSVQKTTITSTLDIDGKLDHASAIHLSFGTNGKIEKLLKKEGDVVNAGDVLATLDNDILKFEVEKAKVNVAIAEANLQQKLAGNTVEDITVADQNVQAALLESQNTKSQNELAISSAQIVLDQAQKKLDTTVSEQSLTDSISTLDGDSAQRAIDVAKQNLEIAEKNEIQNKKNLLLEQEQNYEKAQIKYLSSLSLVDFSLREGYLALEIDHNPGYGMGYLYSATNEPIRQEATQEYKRLKALFDVTTNEDIAFVPENITEVSRVLEERITLLQETQKLLSLLSLGYNYTIESVGLSPERISTLKNNVLTQDTKINTQINDILTAQQSLETITLKISKQSLDDANAITVANQKLNDALSAAQKTDVSESSTDVTQDSTLFTAKTQWDDAKAKYDNAVQKAEIANGLANTKIEIAKAQLQELKNGTRAVDVASLRQQVKNAQVMLSQSQFNLEESRLLAPVAGTIMQVNYEDGDYFQNGPTAKPVFVLVSTNQFELQSFVDESDIAKISEGQKANITFDALDGISAQGVVVFISSVANTDANGVVTYEVLIQLENSQNLPLKEGMTSYADIILKESQDVLAVPVSALFLEEGKSFVTMKDGIKRKVSLGITNGKMTEILSGLEEGEEIQETSFTK